ncbi:MAG: mannitol dehydrogenase family protein [Acidothermus sp.]|nr:mannitol dehydrogenase family protein [Acidothermus sp.]
MKRLSLSTLSEVPHTSRPRIDPRGIGVGIVHLGLGAFHRAHQADFTEEAMARAGGDWGICGVSPRSPRVVDAVGPQDGLYSLLVRGPDGSRARVLTPLRGWLVAPNDPDAVVARISDPTIRIVTLTVSEKGYRHDPATGRLRRDDPEVVADVAGRPPRTVVGLLVRGLQRRMTTSGAPIAVLCCDNLPHNGATLATVVDDFVEMLPDGDELREWMKSSVSFPSCMVDRIVPATTARDRDEVAALLGLRDEAVVVAEPFRQWVIEDEFPAGRPAWEHAGALLVSDVRSYELAKLRMLNGAHSLLGYLGALAGIDTIAETMSRDHFAVAAGNLMTQDAAKSFEPPPSLDLAAYAEDLLERFASPGLHYRTLQVASDGSQKLPQRLLGTIRDRRAAGALPRWAVLAVAGWMRWVWTPVTDVGTPRVLDDPMASRLEALVSAVDDAADVVARLLGVREIFGDDLVGDALLRAALRDDLARLAADGADAAVRAIVAEMAR